MRVGGACYRTAAFAYAVAVFAIHKLVVLGGAVVLIGNSCTPSNLTASALPDMPESATCDALHPPTDPDLLALDPSERAAFAAVRGQGIAVVHYEQKGCDVRLKLLNNCLVRGQYQFIPYWEQQTKTAKDVNELFAKLPVGAMSVAGKLSNERALRADYTLAGMAQLPIGWNVDASQLMGECSEATHIVTRMYLGGFTMAAGKSQELAAQASVFVQVDANSKSSLERVRYAGDPKSCEESRRTQSENIGCAAPLRLVLLPLAQTRECMAAQECQARCDGGRQLQLRHARRYLPEWHRSSGQRLTSRATLPTGMRPRRYDRLWESRSAIPKRQRHAQEFQASFLAAVPRLRRRRSVELQRAGLHERLRIGYASRRTSSRLALSARLQWRRQGGMPGGGQCVGRGVRRR